MINKLIIIAPEIMLVILAMSMQVLVVFRKKSANKIASITMLLGAGIALFLLYCEPLYELTFSQSFLTSSALVLFKAIIIGLTVMSLIIYYDLTRIHKDSLKIEFITITLLATLGVFISMSAKDLLLLFCGLELQSLSGYALAAFNTKEAKSSEAGLKYFVLGALMSCIMLLGMSFIYGLSGSIQFEHIKILTSGNLNIGLIIGCVFVLAAMLFKLSAAPLHIWTPDVYEGAPIASVSYFATAQKFGMLIVLMNFMDGVIGDYNVISNDLIEIVAILSMIIGALGAIRQSSLKRLMAYSTVLNMGYVLIGVCLPARAGHHAAFIYMFIYVISAIGLFACLVALFGKNSDEATFEDLKGVASSRKTLAAAMSIIMFSMIGLPPLAGFFGKYIIFFNAILNGKITLAIIGFLTSVVASFYYLKVVKYMYFMEATQEIQPISTRLGLGIVTAISLSLILFFFTFANNYIG